MEPAAKFIELAKLSQQAFEERRRYEWRLIFAVWIALGLMAYAAITERVAGVFSRCGLWSFCIGVFAFLVLYLNAVRRAHRIDKTWKHYYMDRAEGIEKERPATESLSWIEWLLPQIGLLALALILFGVVMASVSEMSKESPSEPTTPKAAPNR